MKTVKELAPLIDRYVELRPLVNEHSKLSKEIKAGLLGLGRDEIKTPLGNVAALRPGAPARRGLRWVVEKLKEALTPAKFRACCPPAPDEGQLNLAMVNDPGLAKCREEYEIPAGDPRLEVTAA